MNTKHIIWGLFAMFIVISVFTTIQNPTITGFATSEENSTETNEEETEKEETSSSSSSGTYPSLELSLDSSKFAQNSPIEGSVTINVNADLIPTETLTITIDETDYEYTIEELLVLHEYSLEYDNLGFEAENAETTKKLTFTSAGSSLVGLQVPRYSEMNKLEFYLTGSGSSTYPTDVALDIGNEGNTDWYYQGLQEDYSGDTISSEDLDGIAEGEGYIVDTDTYYCELMDLPQGKHFQVSAQYEKLVSGVDINAVILSVPTGNPNYGWTGGSDTCELPSSGTDLSCEIELDYTIEGSYMVCLYASGSYTEGDSLYSLPLDTSETTDTSFTCPTAEDSLCESTGFSNFFIYAEGSTYDNELKTTESISDWETFANAIITGAKYYVGSEPYNGICRTNMCNIPINITTTSVGTITLSGLSMTYEYNGVTQASSSFYDLTKPVTNITAIEAEVLEEKAKINLDLSLLELTLSELGDYEISVNFLDLSEKTNFSVLDPSEVYDAASLISTAIEKYETFTNEDNNEYFIVKMLDRNQYLENAIKDLETLNTQVGFVDEDTLFANTEDIVNGEPWKISFSQTFTDTLIIEPSDIPSEAGEEEAVYFMQDSISVTGTSRIVNIENYNGVTTEYVFIIKEVTANEDIEDATLYEVSPTSFSNLLYITRPSETDGTLGTFSLDLSSGSTEEYYYLTKENVALEDFATVIVTQELEEEEEPECITDSDCSDGYICNNNECEADYSCGDNVCTIPFEDENSCPEDCDESNVAIILIPVVILAAIIGLVIVFKDKIFKKSKDPFSQPPPILKPKTSLSPEASFVKKALTKGVRENTIAEKLKKKGFSDDKIKKAIAEAKKN